MCWEWSAGVVIVPADVVIMSVGVVIVSAGVVIVSAGVGTGLRVLRLRLQVLCCVCRC